MKTLVKALVIVGAVIGIVITALGLLDAISKSAFTDSEQTRSRVVDAIKILAVSGAALAFGLVATSKRSSRTTMIVFGALLVPCGILAILLKSYVSGPFFAVGGLIASLGAAFSRPDDFE